MRLRRALSEFVIDGVETTIPLFQALVNEPDIINGDYSIHWLEKYLKRRRLKGRMAKTRRPPEIISPATLLAAYAAASFRWPRSATTRPCSGSIRSGAGSCRSTRSTSRPALRAADARHALSRMTVDTAFAQVIDGVRGGRAPGGRRPGSTASIERSYCALHRQGHAHSVEVWDERRARRRALRRLDRRGVLRREHVRRRSDASKIALAPSRRAAEGRRLRAARHAVRHRASAAVRRGRNFARALSATLLEPVDRRRAPISTSWAARGLPSGAGTVLQLITQTS